MTRDKKEKERLAWNLASKERLNPLQRLIPCVGDSAVLSYFAHHRGASRSGTSEAAFVSWHIGSLGLHHGSQGITTGRKKLSQFRPGNGQRKHMDVFPMVRRKKNGCLPKRLGEHAGVWAEDNDQGHHQGGTGEPDALQGRTVHGRQQALHEVRLQQQHRQGPSTRHSSVRFSVTGL